MAWDIIAVQAPASGVKIDPKDIPEDVSMGVDEMFTSLEATQRGVVAYETTEARDLARVQIRTYCETRKAGRLTASIWAGYTDGKGSFVQKNPDEKLLPALSLAFTTYVKREKDTKGESNGAS
jgi:hypothetical protein